MLKKGILNIYKMDEKNAKGGYGTSGKKAR
jgi:hypothetical protein